MKWVRRAYELVSSPALAILDGAVIGVLWGTAQSDWSRWVKGVVIVSVLAVGASSFVFRNAWWRPRPKCEVKNCPNRSTGQTCATHVGGAKVDRRVCDEHWQEWRKPGGQWASAPERDRLMREWGWPGEAWWRD